MTVTKIFNACKEKNYEKELKIDLVGKEFVSFCDLETYFEIIDVENALCLRFSSFSASSYLSCVG